MTDDVQVGFFGGRHGDVGSWRRLLELASELTRPAFVAVEWSEALYAAVVALQPEVAEALQTRWPFLSASDGADLAAALAWEVNVPMRIWPGIEIVWLENGFQEADLQRRHDVDAATFARSHARGAGRAPVGSLRAEHFGIHGGQYPATRADVVACTHRPRLAEVLVIPFRRRVEPRARRTMGEVAGPAHFVVVHRLGGGDCRMGPRRSRAAPAALRPAGGPGLPNPRAVARPLRGQRRCEGRRGARFPSPFRASEELRDVPGKIAPRRFEFPRGTSLGPLRRRRPRNY